MGTHKKNIDKLKAYLRKKNVQPQPDKGSAKHNSHKS